MAKEILHIYCEDGKLIGKPVLVQASASEVPKVGSEPAPNPEVIRTRKIMESVQEFLSDHPGVTFKTAYLTVKHENPDLFPEMADQEAVIDNAGREAKVKDEIAKLRKAQGHLTFEMAWHKLQREKPALFDWD